MKIKLLGIITLLFAGLSINTFAQDCVKVKSGSASFLSSKENSLTLEINYDKAKVGDKPLMKYLKSRGDDYVKDWPRDTEKAFDFFVTEFNRRNADYARIRETETVVPAKYKMVFEVLYLNMGDQLYKNIPIVSKSGGDTISGYIRVYDVETNDMVCEFVVDEVRGASFPSDGERLGMAMLKVAKLLCAARQ